MKNLKILAKLIFTQTLILCIGPVKADDIYNFKKCIEESYINNNEIKAARYQLQASSYKVDSSLSGFYPTLKAQISYDKTDSNSFSPNNKQQYSTSLIATQNLFSGNFDLNKYQLTKVQNHFSQLTFENTLVKISSDLKKSYSSLLYAQNLIKLLKDVIKRREENLRLVELRFSSGRENKGSLLLSKAYLARSELELMQAKNSLVYYQIDLNRVLGKDESSRIFINEEIEPNYIENQDFENAVKNSLTFKISQNNVEQSTYDLSLSRSGFFPILNLSGTEGKQGNSFNDGENHFTLGINLVIPIFSGGSDFYAVKTASEVLKSKRLIQDNTYQELLFQIQQSQSLFLETKKKIEVDSLFVEAAKVRSKIAKEQYNNGLISFTDWDLVENDFINYQKNLLQTKKDAIFSLANLENIKGQGVYHEK